jgi:multidrug efflux pump subunit AcrA (membrane-fusion protein)
MPSPSGRLRRYFVALLFGGLLVAAAIAYQVLGRHESGADPAPTDTSHTASAEAADEGPTVIEFPRASWKVAAIDIQAVVTAPLDQVTTFTGKIGFNEDRLAHVYPLVDGRVEEVNVGLGDTVTKGQPMAVIQSREVGQAMLQLAQDRLQLDFARRKNDWTQSVTTNTHQLIGLIRANASIEEIETQLRNRPLGEYRDTLMTAYIEHATSRKNLDRLTPLRTEGIVAARQIFEAEATWPTARASSSRRSPAATRRRFRPAASSRRSSRNSAWRSRG